jgi:arsenate reductase
VDPLVVYALPTCSKSRAVIELLDARHTPFDTVNYQETPPGVEALGRLVDILEGDPADLVRVDDDRFTALGLTPADVDDRHGVIAVLAAHPELMQRPVVVRGNRAVVARPPELAVALLDS